MYKIKSENEISEISLPQYFWYGREPIELAFPQKWDIKVCEMSGDTLTPLPSHAIEEKINLPLGANKIEALARNKKEVAIVIDDITRPTEGALIIPHILKSLYSAGVKDDSIRFIFSLGSHGAHNSEEFRKKLGNEVVERFGVYNHNCYENCIDIGKTRSGLAVKINEELMKCDLKIGIGAILPHVYVGYSGGGKLFLPGLAHIDTIEEFHSFISPGKKGFFNPDNPMAREIDDALGLIGVDFLVNVLVNTKGEIIKILSGDPGEVFIKGVKLAEKVYKTETYDNLDVIVSNAHLKVNEGDIALWAGLNLLKKKHGTCILIMNSPSGQITHYLMRHFGKFTAGRQGVKRARIPEDLSVIVYSQYKDVTTFDPFENQDMIIWSSEWDEIITLLKQKYSESEIKIGILPDGTIQYS